MTDACTNAPPPPLCQCVHDPIPALLQAPGSGAGQQHGVGAALQRLLRLTCAGLYEAAGLTPLGEQVGFGAYSRVFAATVRLGWGLWWGTWEEGGGGSTSLCCHVSGC